jgi:hypothetical protein
MMNENETTPSTNPSGRRPWNKRKLIGAKPPLRASHVWSIRMNLQSKSARATSHYSTSPSTANCAAAMSLRRASMT